MLLFFYNGGSKPPPYTSSTADAASAVPLPPLGKANDVSRFFGRGGACSSRAKKCYFVPVRTVEVGVPRSECNELLGFPRVAPTREFLTHS